MTMSSFRKDLVLLLKPYYWVNIVLSLSFVIAKRAPIICQHLKFLFPDDSEMCELGGRESEILFFLLIVIMIRTRKVSRLASNFLFIQLLENYLLSRVYQVADPSLN